MLRTWEHVLEGNPKSALMADLLQEEEGQLQKIVWGEIRLEAK